MHVATYAYICTIKILLCVCMYICMLLNKTPGCNKKARPREAKTSDIIKAKKLENE